MTREERKDAIANLNMIRVAFIDTVTVEQGRLIDDTFRTAIKALEQEPCGDAISRDDVYGILMRTYFRDECFYEEFKERLEHIPPVTSQPKTGHWIIERDPNTNKIMSYHCSECYDRTGHFVTSADNYCPQCGTKMHLQPIEDMTGDEWVDDVVESMKGETSHTIIPQHGLDIEKARQERIIGHCKDCKHFEYDKVAKVDGIPLIVAHEICNKWGDGCKTKEDGYCFLFEPKESEEV